MYDREGKTIKWYSSITGRQRQAVDLAIASLTLLEFHLHPRMGLTLYHLRANMSPRMNAPSSFRQRTAIVLCNLQGFNPVRLRELSVQHSDESVLEFARWRLYLALWQDGKYRHIGGTAMARDSMAWAGKEPFYNAVESFDYAACRSMARKLDEIVPISFEYVEAAGQFVREGRCDPPNHAILKGQL